eukprot:3305011-Rhodomonas_salina.1
MSNEPDSLKHIWYSSSSCQHSQRYCVFHIGCSWFAIRAANSSCCTPESIQSQNNVPTWNLRAKKAAGSSQEIRPDNHLTPRISP